MDLNTSFVRNVQLKPYLGCVNGFTFLLSHILYPIWMRIQDEIWISRLDNQYVFYNSAQKRTSFSFGHELNHINRLLWNCVSAFAKVCVITEYSFSFQNKHQQDDTYGLSFISRLVVLYSTCFELQGAHHQEFTFSTLYRQSLAYCIIFCCIPPVLLRVLFPTRELLMMSSLKLETCRVKDD